MISDKNQDFATTKDLSIAKKERNGRFGLTGRGLTYKRKGIQAIWQNCRSEADADQVTDRLVEEYKAATKVPTKIVEQERLDKQKKVAKKRALKEHDDPFDSEEGKELSTETHFNSIEECLPFMTAAEYYYFRRGYKYAKVLQYQNSEYYYTKPDRFHYASCIPYCGDKNFSYKRRKANKKAIDDGLNVARHFDTVKSVKNKKY